MMPTMRHPLEGPDRFTGFRGWALVPRTYEMEPKVSLRDQRIQLPHPWQGGGVKKGDTDLAPRKLLAVARGRARAAGGIRPRCTQ